MPKLTDYLNKATTKQNKLDWDNFNFLENLLIFCTEKNRRVPQESGVCFNISPKNKDESLCLLFNTDRKSDSLFKNQITAHSTPVKRPDYLVLYANNNTCIITIIEMKGTAEKNLKGGIEQIKQLSVRLKSEIAEHFPNKFKYIIQGILLAPVNACIPRQEIAEEKNFVIFPICCSNRAELFHYISKKNEKDEKYEHLPHKDSGFGFIEDILIKQALPSRIEDSFKKQNFIGGKDRKGIYINYALSKNEYAVFHLNKSRKTIALQQNCEKREQVIKSLENLGISFFAIESIIC